LTSTLAAVLRKTAVDGKPNRWSHPEPAAMVQKHPVVK